MRIAITGGTGFIGRALTKELVKQNHEVLILTRNPEKHTNTTRIQYIKWLDSGAEPASELGKLDAFINLAGESINSGRWTDERKRRILESRMQGTDEVLNIVAEMPQKPTVLINASAIGIYPPSKSHVYTERSKETGDDFLAETVYEWERKAKQAEEFDVRVIFSRFGIILAKDQGALPKIAMPYQLFAGGRVGSGEQWMSWIHIDDVVKGITFLLEHPTLSGPINFTAPEPVTMNTFGKILGKVLHRPHWLPAPAFALKAVLGEMSILVLDGQKVLPEKLMKAGYSFEYSTLDAALRDIYQ
ncbi:TIGR01777 family oxidoreductase [Falsibacillus albus]|uniref:TIGR01777 family protein n=1 Tax=Falsibacillus albus TaxID=2478915 RepID=A0A3L7JNM2_9BACI|nr:TIGR01777 family oxidoreductase [Falsibacillus albus]RLQ92383.1 TIGR01777 family protein [Falsibacillus albus]